LPAPEAASDANYIGPSGEIEERLTDIWADVLKTDRSLIGANSNFFELGGHSIRALHLINRIQQAFAVQLPLAKIFGHSSIQKLAALIIQLQEEPGRHKTDVIRRAGQRDRYPASAAQERLFYMQLSNKDSVANNIHIAYEIRGSADSYRLVRSLQKLIQRHEGLRTWFSLSGGELFQHIRDEAELPVRIFDPGRYRTPGDVQRELIRPFDLSGCPLMRCGLWQECPTRTYLFVDIHHIVCDGISLNALMNEFKSLYSGEEPALPEFRYVDYAIWEKEQDFGLQREFWDRQLFPGLAGLDLPVIADRGSVEIDRAESRMLRIEGPLYQKIRAYTAAAEVSDLMFLLSVYSILLAKLSGQSELVIGTDAAGRTLPEWKNIVGTFVNVLPIRLRMPGHLAYRPFLEEVKRTVLEASDHQDYPFDRMNTKVQVYFSFTDFFESEVRLRELEFVSVDAGDERTTRYELELSVGRGADWLDIHFLYSADLYDASIIGLMMRYYQEILATVIDKEDVLLENIHL
jgi:acyl carrier protein